MLNHSAFWNKLLNQAFPSWRGEAGTASSDGR
jgi:hypothetical protein